jgi:amino acid adenylation domain-containing protein
MSINIERVLMEFNNTKVDYPRDTSIIGLFDSAVKFCPGKIAIKCDGKEITFGELHAMAVKLSIHLENFNAGPMDIIGVYLPRSIELIACVLAILSIRAIYLPLDTKYPKGRIEAMIEDSKAKCVITDNAGHSRLQGAKSRHSLIDVDIAINSECSTNKTFNVTPPNSKPVYLTYTSGSTGKPKGILLSQEALLNRFYWMWEAFPFDDDDIICQKTATGFVDSMWEILGSVIRGIPIHILSDDAINNPNLLIDAIIENKITRITVVPTLLNEIVGAGIKKQIDNFPLRYMFCSGEALPFEYVKRWYTCFPKTPLINLYGSSEVCADVCCYNTMDLPLKSKNVPIGKPISNSRIYILDKAMQLIPIGKTGTIHVSGICIANGYLNLSDLTNKNFVSNPFEQNAIMFNTGDRGCWNTDGTIEFRGRVDNQIKINGNRVELDDVEQTALSIPGVFSCAVSLHEDVTGKRLVLFYVSDHEISRESLNDMLPDFMIPSIFIKLDTIPLLPNGKIDRKALNSFDINTDRNNKHLVLEPVTDFQNKMSKIWQKVLKVPQVGLNDNFFDLGGHSLAVIRAISKIEEVFSATPHFRDFMEQNLEQFCAAFENKLK